MKNNKIKIKKEKKNLDDKRILIVIITLVILELLTLIGLIISGVNKLMPILILVVPTVIGLIAILLLTLSINKQVKKQNKNVSIKINA